jgi:hypothetical protein
MRAEEFGQAGRTRFGQDLHDPDHRTRVIARFAQDSQANLVGLNLVLTAEPMLTS